MKHRTLKKKKKLPSLWCSRVCLLPWPSFVSVSSFPANTGRGLLGSWGAGTRFQLHMLMYRNPLLGPCWGHRCTICIRTVKTQPVSNPFTDTGVAALPSKTFEKVTHASGSFCEGLFHFVPALLRKNICALSILHGATAAFVVAALNDKQCLHYPHWPVLQSISSQSRLSFINNMTAYPGVLLSFGTHPILCHIFLHFTLLICLFRTLIKQPYVINYSKTSIDAKNQHI